MQKMPHPAHRIGSSNGVRSTSSAVPMTQNSSAVNATLRCRRLTSSPALLSAKSNVDCALVMTVMVAPQSLSRKRLRSVDGGIADWGMRIILTTSSRRSRTWSSFFSTAAGSDTRTRDVLRQQQRKWLTADATLHIIISQLSNLELNKEGVYSRTRVSTLESRPRCAAAVARESTRERNDG